MNYPTRTNNFLNHQLAIQNSYLRRPFDKSSITFDKLLITLSMPNGNVYWLRLIPSTIWLMFSDVQMVLQLSFLKGETLKMNFRKTIPSEQISKHLNI